MAVGLRRDFSAAATTAFRSLNRVRASMQFSNSKLIRVFFPALLAMLAAGVVAQNQFQHQPPSAGPMLSDGVLELDTPELALSLVRSSQTVAALHPKQDRAFDFTPGDLLLERSKNGYYHLGDID